MGVKVSIGGVDREVFDYSIQEDSTPLSPADSSGGVGTMSFSFPRVTDPHLLVDEDVTITDTDRGGSKGRVDSASRSDVGDSVQVDAFSRLGELNIYNVQAQPFTGDLAGAFRYYLGLAAVSKDIVVDPSIAGRAVVFPGWYGELWFNLKQLAAAQSCEIALVSNIIHLRPIRARDAMQNKSIRRGASMGGGSKALGVEVYQYETTSITNQLVYPPFGWTNETPVISVGAGEYIDYNLDLSASVSSIEQPAYRTFVSQAHFTSSVYTVCGDDGVAIAEDVWDRGGGRLSVSINDDTTSLTVHVQAPFDVVDGEGKPISTFSIALGSLQTENRYSTLRIRGTGVAYRKSSVTLPTGLTPRDTSTEIGVTIDNPFITSAQAMYAAGTRAARQFKGDSWTLNGEVTAVNKRGESGDISYPDYAYVKSQYVPRTYGEVKSLEGFAPHTNYITNPQFDEGTSGYANRPGMNLSIDQQQGQLMLKTSGTPTVGISPFVSTVDWLTDVRKGDTLYFEVYMYGGPTYDGTEGRLWCFLADNLSTPPNARRFGANGVGVVTADQVKAGVLISGTYTVATTATDVGWAPAVHFTNSSQPGWVSNFVVRNLTREGELADATYGQVQAKWYAVTEDSFDNQVYGNVNGARVWDERSRRWYRVRSSTITRASIQFEATGDLTHGDAKKFYGAKTYGTVQGVFANRTYRQQDRLGLFDGNA